jgi:hypothetical protein
MSQIYGKYKKTKNRETRKPYNRPATDVDAIIDDIIRSTNTDDVLNKATRYRSQLYNTFLRVGIPTDAYKGFLTRILERFREFTAPQLHLIHLFLFRWEEDSLTGIMKVRPEDSIYASYKAMLQAVFGNQYPFSNKDGMLDLANSTIVLTISEIEKGCGYGAGCTRMNPLHKSLMHKSGGRRTRPRKTRKQIRKQTRKQTNHKN